MAGKRIKRVNEQLKREIAAIVVGEVKDPRVGPATVTDVATAPDLTMARVYVQVMGDEAQRRETMKGLKAAAAFIRSELGQRVEMRRVPELRFELDRTLEQALRIEALLEEARRTEGPDDEEEGEG